MGDKAQGELLQQTRHYCVPDLRLLAQTLGFPRNFLESCIPSGLLSEEGISSKELGRLLDLGYFTTPLHFTFNMKSGSYNVKLILKCLDLLDKCALSFSDIQEAKLSFSSYEHLDQKGVKSEINMLLKVIKGNSLQPKNTLRDDFQKTVATSTSLVQIESLRKNVSNREVINVTGTRGLLLAQEWISLLLATISWLYTGKLFATKDYIEGLRPENCGHINKPGTPRKLEMCGFVVSPQKLAMYLKQKKPTFVEKGRVQLYEFLDVLTICEPRSKFSIQDKRVQSTDKTKRGVYQMDDMRISILTPDEKLVRHLNRRFQDVDSWLLPRETLTAPRPDYLNKLQETEILNGSKPQPPQSKSDFSSEDLKEAPWTLVTPVPQGNSLQPKNTLRDYFQKTVATSTSLLRCHCYMPKRDGPILSKEDIRNTQNTIEDLRYQIETLDERSRWDLNWRLDYYVPGYRERLASRPTQAEPQPVQHLKKTSKDNVFQRLSAPKRRIPSPCHAMTCNAFKLGIASKTLEKRTEHSKSSLSGKRRALLYP